MTDAARLLARYLEQRAELGERELVLPAELLRELSRWSAQRTAPAPRAERPTAPPTAPPADRPAPPRSHGPSTRPTGPASPGAVGEPRLLRAPDGSRSFLVRAEGQADAGIVVLADVTAPGEWPFAGPAGSLLDRLLLAVGVPGSDVLRCALVPEQEAAAGGDATPLTPRRIVACGAAAVRALVDVEEPLTRLRTRNLDFGGTPIVATFALGALVRHPAWLRPAWNDFQRLRTSLDG